MMNGKPRVSTSMIGKHAINHSPLMAKNHRASSPGKGAFLKEVTMEKLWCIINLKHLTDPHWFSCRSRYGQRLDKQHGPTAFYTDRKQAEEELFRLSDFDGEFALFELVGYVVDSPVTIMAKHIQAPDFDEIPF